jgi:PAS domain S-box-containing protein
MTATAANLVERHLALAMDAARLGSWTWDLTSGVAHWDRRLEEMHGLRPGTFGGTFEDWVRLLHPDDRDVCVAQFEAALDDPGPFVLRHRSVWPDGSIHTIESRGTVLIDAEGRAIGTTGIAIDVPPREQLVDTLQKVLLPVALPTVPGIKVATRYRTAQAASDVGGDWYATVPLPDGRLGIAIGDVAGSGLGAVAGMAAARFSLRALALTEPAPEVVLGRLNEVVRVFERDTMVTALYGVVDPKTYTWRYASAGHLPAVLRTDAGATFLEEATDPPLGFATAFQPRCAALQKGATLLLYTDGLVERRHMPLDDGLERLRQACRTGPADPDELCDYVVEKLLEDANTDDVALLAITLA